MKYLLASDLDGTLLNKDSKVSKNNISAVKKFINDGNYFAIATGRPYFRCNYILKDLDIISNNQYMVCYNGALVCSTDNKNIIYECTLSHEDLNKIIDIAERLNTHILLYRSDYIMASGIASDMESLRTLDCVKVLNSYEPLKKETFCYKLIFLLNNNEMSTLRNNLPKWIFDNYTVVQSSPNFLEVLNKKVDKGEGVKIILDYLKLPYECSYGVGDEENDISLLRKVAHPIAMANAKDYLKEHAEEITKSNDEDGVAYLIENIIGRK